MPLLCNTVTLKIFIVTYLDDIQVNATWTWVLSLSCLNVLAAVGICCIGRSTLLVCLVSIDPIILAGKIGGLSSRPHPLLLSV